MSRSVIAIFHDDEGQTLVHASGKDCPSDYDTLCGLDGDDAEVGTEIVDLPRRDARITCQSCRQIWGAAMAFSRSDFA